MGRSRAARAKNHVAPENAHVRGFRASNRVGVPGRPSGTIDTEGQVSSPLIVGRIEGGSEYPAMLERELPREAPPPCGLRTASFFCGCGGFDLGLRSAGFALAYANDLYEAACTTFERNLGHAPVVGDVRGQRGGDVGEVDVLTGGFPCFPAGTLVQTERGLVPIELVRVGELVTTHAGDERRVSVVMSKADAPLLVVEAMGAPPIAVTPEHPFWCRRRSWSVVDGEPVRCFGAPEWVEARFLSSDDFVCQPVDGCGEERTWLTPALAYLVGRWLGDGWIVDHARTSKVPRGRRGSRVTSRVWKMMVCSSHAEADELAARIAEAGLHATRAREGPIVKFHISSRLMVERLVEFGRLAHGKRLPGWVFRLPVDLKRALWNGWVDADGHVEASNVSANTVSEELAFGMARVARSVFGVAVSHKVVRKERRAVIGGREVSQRDQHRIVVSRWNRESFVEDGSAWVPVRSVARGGRARVFNLEVEDRNSYVAGSFAVHNCVTFSTAGKRAGVVDDVNGKLYLELCRLIGEVRPRYFVAENVKGILSANGGAAVKLVLAAFLRLGYRVDHELVNMAEHGVPQTRLRVIFVGVRLDQWRGSFRFPARTHRLGANKKADGWLPRAVSLREAIGDLGDPVATMHGDAFEKMKRGAPASGYSNSKPRGASEPSHSLATQPNVVADQSLAVDRAGGYAPDLPPLKGGSLVAARVPMAFNPRRPADEPSPTVVVDTRNVELVERSPERTQMRRMSVRECARVQTFPDWFEFEGSPSDGYKQVGNAVPPLYAKRLGLALREYDRRPLMRRST